MGKWLDRVIDRDGEVEEIFLDTPRDHTDKTDKTNVQPRFTGPPLLTHLTDAEREAYQQYIKIMISPKFALPMDQAEREAMQLVTRAKQSLQARQAAKDYKRVEYVKIYSTVLSRAVYMAKNDQAAKRVPDKSLPVFLESDLEAVKGLALEEAKILLEARILLGGPITVEDSAESSAPKKMDGKMIAKRLYGKGKE